MRNFLWMSGCFVLLGAVCTANDVIETVAVGKPAPDFTLTGIDGEQFKLSDVLGNGKSVALMFSRAHW